MPNGLKSVSYQNLFKKESRKELMSKIQPTMCTYDNPTEYFAEFFISIRAAALKNCAAALPQYIKFSCSPSFFTAALGLCHFFGKIFCWDCLAKNRFLSPYPSYTLRVSRGISILSWAWPSNLIWAVQSPHMRSTASKKSQKGRGNLKKKRESLSCTKKRKIKQKNLEEGLLNQKKA